MLFTADLHGNELQYAKLVDFAKDISADFVIIGGDLAPKNISKNALIETQRMFFAHRLPEILQPLKDAKIKTYLMMGNDDCAANYGIFERCNMEFYNIIHNQRLHLKDGFEITGYSYVPITPFGLKDWENLI